MQSTAYTNHTSSNDPGRFNGITPGSRQYRMSQGPVLASQPSINSCRQGPPSQGPTRLSPSYPNRHVVCDTEASLGDNTECDSDTSATTWCTDDDEDGWTPVIRRQSGPSKLRRTSGPGWGSQQFSSDARGRNNSQPPGQQLTGAFGPMSTTKAAGSSGLPHSTPWSTVPGTFEAQMAGRLQSQKWDRQKLEDELRRQESMYSSLYKSFEHVERRNSDLCSQAANQSKELLHLRNALNAQTSELESLRTENETIRFNHKNLYVALNNRKSQLERSQAELQAALDKNEVLQRQSDLSLSRAEALTKKERTDALTIASLTQELGSLRSRIGLQSAVLHDVCKKVAPLCGPQASPSS